MSFNAAAIVRKLKAEHPKVYKKLIPKKPSIPKKMLNSLTRQAKELIEGDVVTLSVGKKSLLMRCRFYWECCDDVALEVLGFQHNLQPKKTAERWLVKALATAIDEDRQQLDDIIWSLREEACKSKEFSRFKKRLKEYCKKLDAHGSKYDFDYDRDIGLESE